MWNKIKTFLILTGGTLLFTVGIYFFKFPNHFSTGGVSGLSVILGAVTPLTPGTVSLILNLFLLLLGFLFVGNQFGGKTVYCTLLQTGSIYLLEWLVPLEKPLTNQPLMELLIAVFLTAAGSAILFNHDASTGGTDIVAMIIRKYAQINISRALFLADCAVVAAAFFVFGVETWLFCVVGFFAKVFLVNNILEGINRSKYCTVVTDPRNVEEIKAFIIGTLHHSATLSNSFEGAYDGSEKCVILTVLNRRQTILLKKFVRSLDKKAFIIVTNTSDICGKGFRELM